MRTILWMIAGIIMFAITIFVHRHSYEYRYDEKPMALPRWQYWLWLLIALIPVANVGCFCAGAFGYIIGLATNGVYFKCKAKWWTKVVEFLNKSV